MNPISGYVKLAIAAVALAAIAALGYFTVHWYDGQINAAYDHGVQAERTTWQLKETAQAQFNTQAVLDQAKQDRASQAQIDAANLKVEQDHAKAIQALRQRNAALDSQLASYGGMRVDRASVCGSGNTSADTVHSPTQTGGPGSNDAWIAGTVALPADTQRRLRALADEADRVTEAARAGQTFAIEQGFYPRPSAPVTASGAPVNR